MIGDQILGSSPAATAPLIWWGDEVKEKVTGHCAQNATQEEHP